MDTFPLTIVKPGNKHTLCVVQTWTLGHGLTFIFEGLGCLCSSPCDGFTLHYLPSRAYLGWWPEFNLVGQVRSAHWPYSNASERAGSSNSITLKTYFFWKFSTINKAKQCPKLHFPKTEASVTVDLLLPLSLTGIKLKSLRNLRHF